MSVANHSIAKERETLAPVSLMQAADWLPRTLEQRGIVSLELATLDESTNSVEFATGLLDLFPDEPAFFWRTRSGDVEIAIGAAVTITASGPDRFAHIRLQAEATKVSRYGDGEKSRLASSPARFYGAFTFAPRAFHQTTWSDFADASFVLPRWNVRANRLTLTVNADDLRSRPDLLARIQQQQQTVAHFCASWSQDRVSPRTRANGGRSLVATNSRLDDNAAQQHWAELLTDIAARISSNAAAKIVAARSKQIKLHHPLTIAQACLAIADAQPHCFTLGVRPSGSAQFFVGAPPELLIHKHGTMINSEALAGSLPRSTHTAEQALINDDKNRAEHSWVVDAIASSLTAKGAALAPIGNPVVRTLPNIVHLDTKITGTVTEQTHVLELVEALHPTPAVGGWPRQQAIEWITTHEQDRGLYASPVGWFDQSGDGEFAVAIRSALVLGDHATLFAGAGIVAASDQVREFEETEAKFAAIQQALEKFL